MKKIYIVVEEHYEGDDDLLGTFSSEKEAQQYLNKFCDSDLVFMKELTVDEEPTDVSDRFVQDKNGNILYCCSSSYETALEEDDSLISNRVDVCIDPSLAKKQDLIQVEYTPKSEITDVVNVSGNQIPTNGIIVPQRIDYTVYLFAKDSVAARDKSMKLIKGYRTKQLDLTNRKIDEI